MGSALCAASRATAVQEQPSSSCPVNCALSAAPQATSAPRGAQLRTTTDFSATDSGCWALQRAAGACGQRLSSLSGGDGACSLLLVAVAVHVSTPAQSPDRLWIFQPSLAVSELPGWLCGPENCRSVVGLVGPAARQCVGQVVVALQFTGMWVHLCVRVRPGDSVEQVLLRAAAALRVAEGSAACVGLILPCRCRAGRALGFGALGAPSLEGALCLQGRALRGGMRPAAQTLGDRAHRANATLEGTKATLKGCVDRMKELQERFGQLKCDRLLASDSASLRLAAPNQRPSQALRQVCLMKLPCNCEVEISQ